MAKASSEILVVGEKLAKQKLSDLPLFEAAKDIKVDKKRRAKQEGADTKKTRPAKQKPGASGAGAAGTKAKKAAHAYQNAQSIAHKQREISVSEFFAKNRHLLGFDSLPKALLTTVKEAVDNSLDACEESGILPEVIVEISELAENRYKVAVEDSGPGIVRSQVSRIFGKLLYGSKFHTLKQARGQQGIGISAAVMYAQLTTGKPARILTKTGSKQAAHAYELQINTKANTPRVLTENVVDWEREHGTRIEMEIMAAYKRGQRSVDAYLHQVALANPHVRIVYRGPKDGEVIYERLKSALPDEPLSIKPHPHGVELGILMDMLKSTKSRNIRGFLSAEFSRMSSRSAVEVIEHAGLSPRTSPKRISRDEAERLIRAFSKARIMKPPTNCLSAIGEELLMKSLEREAQAPFYAAVTRPPAVYRGNPFQIEAALAYGATGFKDDDMVRVYRFANRAPLIYQQAACAITQSVISTAWKNYGVQQAKGALPAAPMIVLVHIASVWVPFTSESKEAIAHYPEITKEIRLALQECGRKLARFIRKGVRQREEAKKTSYIERYIPHIGIALREILTLSERDEKKVVERLKQTLEKSRKN